MTMNNYIVEAVHIGSGDNDHNVPYIFSTHLDLSVYTKKAQKTIALLALQQKNHRETISFCSGDGNIKRLLKFRDLIASDNELFIERFAEFSQINSVKKISMDELQHLESLLKLRTIALSESKLQDIKQTEMELLHAVTHAQFAPKLILFNGQIVDSLEQIDEKNWVFDTDCLIAQAAKFTQGGLEMMAVKRQYCRLVVSCTKGGLNSMVVDDQFYSDFDDEKKWELLLKVADEDIQSASPDAYEIDGEKWVIYELLEQEVLDEKLSQVSESLAEISTDQANQMLNDETAELIFKRTKAEI